jgi:antitoxin ParD1/3/4
MATRNISLTDALDQFVETQVMSGDYHNASEVVRAGLRLLKSQADEEAAKLVRLRAAVQLGLDEIERGEGIDVKDVEAWLEGLGRERTV